MRRQSGERSPEPEPRSLKCPALPVGGRVRSGLVTWLGAPERQASKNNSPLPLEGEASHPRAPSCPWRGCFGEVWFWRFSQCVCLPQVRADCGAQSHPAICMRN